MTSRLVNTITGLIGLGVLATFVIGLAVSISKGFAGVMGGLPFSIIVGFVLLLALYDFFDNCIRKPRSKNGADASQDTRQ